MFVNLSGSDTTVPVKTRCLCFFKVRIPFFISGISLTPMFNKTETKSASFENAGFTEEQIKHMCSPVLENRNAVLRKLRGENFFQ